MSVSCAPTPSDRVCTRRSVHNEQHASRQASSAAYFTGLEADIEVQVADVAETSFKAEQLKELEEAMERKLQQAIQSIRADLEARAAKLASQAPKKAGDLENRPVKLKANVWDAAVVVGADPLHPGTSVFLVLLVLLNLGLQALFLGVITTPFLYLTNPLYSDGKVETLKRWRRNAAHEYRFFDSNSDKSLAARVCEMDYSLACAPMHPTLYETLHRTSSLHFHLFSRVSIVVFFAFASISFSRPPRSGSVRLRRGSRRQTSC